MAKKQKPRSLASLLAQAYDLLFKVFFDDASVVRAFVRYCLPEEVRQLIQTSYLHKAESAYVSQYFGAALADVVYKVRLRSGACRIPALLLFEHKSSQPTTPIHIQLLAYMLPVWRKNERERKRMTPIIPVLIHHGKYPLKKRHLREHLPCKIAVLERMTPDFEFVLFDLNTVSVVELREHKELEFLGVLLLTLKFARRWEELAKHMPDILSFIEGRPVGAREERLLRAWAIFIQKVLAMNKIRSEEFKAKIPRTGQEAYEMMLELYGPEAAEMIADLKVARIRKQIQEEALRKGKEEGLREGRQEGLRKGRQEGFREGRQKGLQKGLQKGRQQGKEEALEEVVAHLLRAFPGWSAARVAAAAGVSRTLVSKVRRKLVEASNNGHNGEDVAR
ncbi:MAG: Rpn family recombination-promoting nuclease/putative transposase [Saprospiraceae bacterium]|nr:Rpn family recombination-promoting nuclease/putative transposase [Saprospiraceae bacterium]